MDNPTYSAPFQPLFQTKLLGTKVTPLSLSAGSLYASAGSLHIPARSLHGSAVHIPARRLHGSAVHIPATSLHGSEGNGLHISTLCGNARNVCGSAINIGCDSATKVGTGSTRNRVCTSTTNIFSSGRASNSQCELPTSLANPLYDSSVGAGASRKVMSAEHLLDNSLGIHTVPHEEDKNDYANIGADEYDFPLSPGDISNTEPCSGSRPNSESYLTTSTFLSDSEHIYELATSSATPSTRVSIYSDVETASFPISQQQALLPKPCD